MTEALLSFDEVRNQAHDLAKRRRAARITYQRHGKDAAEAELEFRKELAKKYGGYRAMDKAGKEAEILANGDVAHLRAARDMANVQAKASLLLIESIEREQATLRQLAEFSKDLETVG